MYYDRETHVMVNQSVNEFYTQFLSKIYALPQDAAFPLDISTTFFNKLSPDVREFLISDGFQIPPRPPTKNNHQGNQRLLLVINAAAGAENNTRAIKAAVQPESGSRHPKTFMGILGRNPSTKMVGLVSSFQSEKRKYMLAEAMKKYVLASAEAAYEYLG